MQTIHPELLLPLASEHGVTICLRPRVGQHVVAGTTLGWVWAPVRRPTRGRTADLSRAVHADIRIGFERTLEQDVAFGIRQQIDIACKALSAAINDPYTAVQAIDHLTGGLLRSGRPPLGAEILTDPAGPRPGDRARQHVRGLHLLRLRRARSLRRRRPHGDDAILRLIRSCVEVLPPGSDRLHPLRQAALGILEDAERGLARPVDLKAARRAAESLLTKITAKQSVPG